MDGLEFSKFKKKCQILKNQYVPEQIKMLQMTSLDPRIESLKNAKT